MTDNTPLPLTFPLHGTRLIEASAGTGKTYALAALYLRLVLGHGGDNAYPRPLLPPEILVVTFTEAATAELRERIRNRLAEAAHAFATGQCPNDDAILPALLADCANDNERQTAARRLDAAAQWMDEAAIHTIHGFCNRMLKQHAFDSGSLFSLELKDDIHEEQYQATCDYWRRVIGVFFPPTTAAALGKEGLASPEALLKATRPLLGQVPTAGDSAPPDSPPEEVQHWYQRLGPHQDLEQQTRETLTRELPALRAWIEEALANKWLSGNSYKTTTLPAMFDVLARYAEGHAATSEDDEKKLVRFSLNGMNRTKAGKEQPLPFETPALLDQVLDGRAELALPRRALLTHAATWIGHRIELMHQQNATLGYDDMLKRLYQALAHPHQGTRLAAVIRDQFPVALIDEFQDTDPTQYGIFSMLYDNQPDTGWFMIGDPKQAVYAFRGADVYTYLQARQATTGQHYTLDRNFRSATAMVAATNQLFEHGNALANGDVFLLDKAIPFQPVAAQGRTEVLEIDGQPQAGATLWVDDGKAISKGRYQERLATCAANEIARLLNGGVAGVTGLRDGARLNPLRSRDIAVLVRDRNEAATLRDALARRQVRSVYLSDRDSVFATSEAADLSVLLQACALPEDDRRVHSALACTTLTRTYAELDALNQSETLWEACINDFHRYRQIWQQRGVLPMLRTLLLDFEIPQRLKGTLDGERTLTNLLHLAELLQQAATRLDGEQALIRWLQVALEQDRHNGDDTILRLESDDDRVRVITIHKAKGLEYPLVFLPFICSFRATNRKKPPLRYHRNGILEINLEPDDDATLAADRERLAEDMRLLYVALTRARHACWLGLAPYAPNGTKENQLTDSAIGRLLFGSDGVANDGLLQALAPLNGEAIRVQPLPDDVPVLYQPDPRQRAEREVMQIHRTAAAPWWIASYSALRKVQEELPPADARGDQLNEAPLADQDQPNDTPTALTGLHAFPRGPLPGTLLHELLEQAGNDGFATTLDHPEDLDHQIQERLAACGWQQHEPALQRWWRHLLATALPLGRGNGDDGNSSSQTVVLADLATTLPEMEFLFPARQVSVARLDDLIHQHIAPGQPRPRLQQDRLNGMLKGFIDLVFEHQGRYYVLDYKSNWLGPDDSAYTPDAIRDAVLAHRYDVQYALYLLALHRLLRSRLGQRYDPQHHLGGALYVFLRGIDGPAGGTLFDRPSQTLIDDLDQLFVPENGATDAA